MTDKVQERRKFFRVLVRVLVDFESPDTYLYDYSSNLSEGGIFIETEKPFEQGSSLTLRFTLPGVDRVFEAKGAVRWLNMPGEDGERLVPDLGPGMGIQFVDIEETDQDFIRQYVTQAK